MLLSDLLSPDRILVDGATGAIHEKQSALRALAELLAPALGADAASVGSQLADREQLQSTGIGDGVAIPHTCLDAATGQVAALVICPTPVPFDSIDGAPVSIIVGVVGPRQATGDHLRALARISRLLRNPETRARLVGATDAAAVWALLQEQDAAGVPGGAAGPPPGPAPH